ncbi:MAG: PH domain-containing protein [Planctomycetota bacterium]
MTETEFEIQRDRLVHYKRVSLLLVGLGLIGWLLLHLGLFRLICDWAKSLSYRLSDHGVHVSSTVRLWGITLYRQEKTIPLGKITDVQLVQGPVLHWLDLWAIQVHTASMGTRWPEATLYAVKAPEAVRDQIVDAMRTCT